MADESASVPTPPEPRKQRPTPTNPPTQRGPADPPRHDPAHDPRSPHPVGAGDLGKTYTAITGLIDACFAGDFEDGKNRFRDLIREALAALEGDHPVMEAGQDHAALVAGYKDALAKASVVKAITRIEAVDEDKKAHLRQCGDELKKLCPDVGQGVRAVTGRLDWKALLALIMQFLPLFV